MTAQDPPEAEAGDFAELAMPSDQVGLLEGLMSTRAIRRYTSEAVPDSALRTMLFAATRAPSGSNAWKSSMGCCTSKASYHRAPRFRRATC